MKTVTTAEARQQFDQLIREVASGKASLTIGEEGNPVAVVLPADEDAQRSVARRRVLTTLSEMQAAANLSPEEAEELALEAVTAVRAAAERP